MADKHLSTYEMRQIARNALQRVTEEGARGQKVETIRLCRTVERLCETLDETRRQLADHEAQRWVGEAYDGICEFLRELGIEIGSVDGQRWDWRWGGEQGTEYSIAGAARAALKAAGATKAAPVQVTR